ncbi:MAG: GntR family transcriptional regulator [Firmicutes bacterium]|nr:GntR family transcriptional regulator [Bacillota bacterium]
MNYEKFQKLRDASPFLSLNEAVYKYLFEEIISLNIIPGTKLNETQIAKSFGISRSPIQIAIKQLCEDGLVQKRKGKTPRVTLVKYEECKQLCEMRIGIEGEAAYHAAKRMTQNELEGLRNLVFQFEKCIKSENYSIIPVLDDQIHKAIIDACRNEYIQEAYEVIKNKVLRYRWCSLINGIETQEFVNMQNRHIGIYYALKNHLSDQARKEMIQDCKGMFHAMRYL